MKINMICVLQKKGTNGVNRNWADLAPDLIIEQILMISLKTTGGLTQGTDFNDIQRTMASINANMLNI